MAGGRLISLLRGLAPVSEPQRNPAADRITNATFMKIEDDSQLRLYWIYNDISEHCKGLKELGDGYTNFSNISLGVNVADKMDNPKERYQHMVHP